MRIWQKKGLIFAPNQRYSWMQTHASLPIPIHLYEDIYRVYFSTRDKFNRNSVGFFEININDPYNLLSISEVPVLTPGPLGGFDDHGVYASSIVHVGNQLYMYYIGWNPGPYPLFYSSIGLAISIDSGISFQKKFNFPIMARNEYDPILVTSPFVIFENNFWKMWYVSGLKWEKSDHNTDSFYHIKYAFSLDGIKWHREGIVALDLQTNEKNIARCCVVPKADGYEAWYSYNCDEGYRIGYATSKDSILWERKDIESGITISDEASDWDAKSVAYPYVIYQGRKAYMFYNGNAFGRDGIGLAVADYSGR